MAGMLNLVKLFMLMHCKVAHLTTKVLHIHHLYTYRVGQTRDLDLNSEAQEVFFVLTT